MASRIRISAKALKKAFRLAEETLKGERNRSITEAVVNDTLRSIRWEKSLDGLFITTFSDVFPEYEIGTKHRIDICMSYDGQVSGAIECKGMVSNSHRPDRFKDSLDVQGIRGKLSPRNERNKNSIETDIERLETKMPSVLSHWEIFVPIVYEIYRNGANDAELYEERKPWTTHPEYKRVRKTLREDFLKWFEGKYPGEFTLIHAADKVELMNARRIWRELCRGKATCTPVSEAYVNFFAFGRYVEN